MFLHVAVIVHVRPEAAKAVTERRLAMQLASFWQSCRPSFS